MWCIWMTVRGKGIQTQTYVWMLKFKVPLSRGPIPALLVQCETRGRFEPYSWKYRANIWSLHIATWKSNAKLQTSAALRFEIKQTGTRESCSTLSWGCRVGAHKFKAGSRCGTAGSMKWKGIFLQVLGLVNWLHNSFHVSCWRQHEEREIDQEAWQRSVLFWEYMPKLTVCWLCF